VNYLLRKLSFSSPFTLLISLPSASANPYLI
jgi:hypothetical protein